MNTSRLTFITSNPSKAEQLDHHLDYPIDHQGFDLPEIQSLDLKEIVTQKVMAAYERVQAPVLVEDTSLVFTALGRLPGPFIKWFLVELDNGGLCKMLDGYTDRGAYAQVCFGLYDGQELQIFEGGMKGNIADSPRGERGFGWDPIFIPEGYQKTWGEMSLEEQTETSMRRIALKQLESFLKRKTYGR